MWSISVEEQFYLIWPLITKFGGKVWVMAASLIFIAGAAITIGISYPRGYLLWYSTFVEFLFFGTGALLAVAFRGGAFRMAAVWRLLFIAGGLTVWILSVAIAPVANAAGRPMTRPGMFMAYTGADLGCILIFIAFLGASGVPKVLVYLGKISYGLYVFHAAMITLASWIVERALLGLPVPVFATVAAKDLLALLFSVALASVSYRFLEMPFLRVKERFAFVRSRPAESSFGNPEF